MNIRLKHFDTPATWAADSLLENDGLVDLDSTCLGELRNVAADLASNPLPVEALSPHDFDTPACRLLMNDVRHQLTDGIGFAILDRLPVDELDSDTAIKLSWLLMSMISRPVAQKWDGTMIYDVTDTGAKFSPGSGVRSSKTNGSQGYHTDNAFNLPPDFVSLLCLQTARSGGLSGLVSLETVYNILLDEYPDLIPRLYEPFYWDRQKEHAPNEEPCSFKPVFESDGERVFACYTPGLIYSAYKVRNEQPDAAVETAIHVLMEVPEREGLGKSFQFERGQIQIVNNRRLGHRRTGFEDWSEPERRRRLVRIWLRDKGRPFYMG